MAAATGQPGDLSADYRQDQIVAALAQEIADDDYPVGDLPLILLRDLLPEICACFMFKAEGIELASCEITSASDQFPATQLSETGAWRAFSAAFDAGAIDASDMKLAANNSAAFDVRSQMVEAGDEINGASISFVPLGFEWAMAEQRQRKTLLDRIKSFFGGSA